ncbi:MAG: hypothetical protein KAJ05_09100, partial [Candidatus Latescibacteria bacterium]|nr:hypothetical protein [Candidatus Latescibacterota bacterium]
VVVKPHIPDEISAFTKASPFESKTIRRDVNITVRGQGSASLAKRLHDGGSHQGDHEDRPYVLAPITAPRA